MLACGGCQRTFGGKRALKIHETECSYYEAPKKSAPPPIEDMWEIIVDLKKQVTHLEQKFKNWGGLKPSIPQFNVWKRGWVVSDKEMRFLLDNGYASGVANILCANITKHSPIKYLNKGIQIFENNQWRALSDEDMCNLIAHIQQKIAGAFINWQKQNADIVNNNDGTFERYMIEAFGGNKNSKASNQQIYKNLLQHCRTQI